MSALSQHQTGDCYWPCHYCQLEDERALTFTEPDYDDEEDTE